MYTQVYFNRDKYIKLTKQYTRNLINARHVFSPIFFPLFSSAVGANNHAVQAPLNPEKQPLHFRPSRVIVI